MLEPTCILITDGVLNECDLGQTFAICVEAIWAGDRGVTRSTRDIAVAQIGGAGTLLGLDRTREALDEIAARTFAEGGAPKHVANILDYHNIPFRRDEDMPAYVDPYAEHRLGVAALGLGRAA